MTDARQKGDGSGTPAAPEGISSSLLLTALGHAGVAVFIQDASLRYVWRCNTPPSWNVDVLGKIDADFLPGNVAEVMSEAKAAVLRGDGPRRLELEIPGPQGSTWYEVWLDAWDDGPGGTGILSTAVETTEQRRREQTLRTLLREVSHRSKNLLAIIQSIAAQTGRYSDTIGEFLTRFRGRLQSLSSSQDLVTSSNWRGADLAQLVNGQVARYCADPAVNLRITGENPYLNPNGALHIGLALHELAVNSVSYGALSQPDGQVSIDVKSMPDGQMEFTWCETLRSSRANPERKRFGTVALERIVPTSLNSESKLAIEAGRLTYRLLVPPESYHQEGS